MRPDAHERPGVHSWQVRLKHGVATLLAHRRRRRLALVLALTPGAVVVMLLAPALRSGPLLLFGGAMILTALLSARMLARWLGAGRAAPSAPTEPNLETVPDPSSSENDRC